MGRKDEQRILTSLPLEVLLFFNHYYTMLYVIFTVGLLMYKDYKYPYPDNTSVVEGLFAIFYIFVDNGRHFVGSKGNKTEQVVPLLCFLLLSAPIIVTNVYYLQLQTYVTRLDVVLNSIALVFVGLENILALLTILAFCRHQRH
eukprot:g4792.t1